MKIARTFSSLVILMRVKLLRKNQEQILHWNQTKAFALPSWAEQILHWNQTIPFSLPQLVRNSCCIETKPNNFHFHSWSETDITLKPNLTIFFATAGQEQILHWNQTKPFSLPQLVRSRYSTETKPNLFHCHSWSGTDIALKPNQTKPFYCPSWSGTDIALKPNQIIFIATAGQDRETSSDQKTSWTRTWF